MRLNIGCGGAVAEGWVNADRHPSVPGALEADVCAGLPWSTGVFEIVAAHHVLQMIPYPELVPALAELHRVLEPGGILRLSFPSLLRAVRAHARGDAEWFPRVAGEETSLDGLFCGYLTDYGNSRSVLTPGWVAELCFRAGFETAVAASFGYSPLGGTLEGICDLDDRGPESNWVEARR